MPPLACDDDAAPVAVGAGERAPHVAEELALEERLRDRRAVHARRTVPRDAGPPIVDGPRDELLAGPALAVDHHRDRRVAHAIDHGEDPAHRLARAHDPVSFVAALELRARRLHLAFGASSSSAVRATEDALDLGLGAARAPRSPLRAPRAASPSPRAAGRSRWRWPPGRRRQREDRRPPRRSGRAAFGARGRARRRSRAARGSACTPPT